MCTHRGPGDVEDCILTPDRVTGALVCVQHGRPIPRQRDDELDVIVPTIQAEVAGPRGSPVQTPRLGREVTR